MELIKKNIHMDRARLTAGTQITLEDDMNIPDVKPDVNTLIYEKGQVKTEEIKPFEGHVTIKGKLMFSVLYQAGEAETGLAGVSGELPFEEQVFMEGVTGMDQIEACVEMEDLKVGMINSRKLSIQALLSIRVTAEELYDEETAVDVYQDVPMEYRKQNLELAQLAIRKNDIFRMKEEIQIPQNYPNIFEIIWNSVTLNDVEFKALEEKISIQGDIHAFFLYEGEGEEQPIRSLETVIPFSGVLECHGCKETMIPDISYEIGHMEAEARPDLDGEERVIGLEMVLDIGIRLYEEEHVEILSDVYGVTNEVTAHMRPAEYKQLLARNTGKCKVADHVKIGSPEKKLLQVLHSEGMVQIDGVQTTEDGLLVDGSVTVKILYITGDDSVPYGSVKGILPFSYTLEVPGISDSDYYSIQPELEQLTVVMLDSEELDVKGVVALKSVVFRKIVRDVVSDIEVTELNSETLNELPGIAIYMVQAGDNLWNIGKRYYVPVDTIKDMNNLSSDEVKAGDKLLIVKGVNVD